MEWVLNQVEPYIILILGKGCENRQKVNGKLEDYISDSVCIKNIINEYENKCKD